MSLHRTILLSCLFATSGCAGCGLFWDDDDNARFEEQGTPPDQDVSTQTDASGAVDEHDGSGSTADVGIDLAEPGRDSGPAASDAGPDGAPEEDLGPAAICGNGDVESGEACDDSNTADGDYCAGDCAAETGRCGDGVLQSNESCDDGVTVDCVTTRDGGDGVCVPAGECSPDYVDDGTGCVPELMNLHVHIYVANDCTMMVDPEEITVPAGRKVQISWHNHSADYPVDVWQSYIGGFTDLPPGQTWDEQFEWCANVNPYTGYSDITTVEVCPSHRFLIHCL